MKGLHYRQYPCSISINHESVDFSSQGFHDTASTKNNFQHHIVQSEASIFSFSIHY